VASDCCSPDITGRSSENSSISQHKVQKKPIVKDSKKSPNGTPLDALFQLSNKNFDEVNGEGEYNAMIIDDMSNCFQKSGAPFSLT
jgi:hypothetical protein